MFENCCTSCDIPLQLVIYSSGKTHRFEGGLPMFEWHFADSGPCVVFSQQTVHSACACIGKCETWRASERAAPGQVDIPESSVRPPRLHMHGCSPVSA